MEFAVYHFKGVALYELADIACVQPALFVDLLLTFIRLLVVAAEDGAAHEDLATRKGQVVVSIVQLRDIQQLELEPSDRASDMPSACLVPVGEELAGGLSGAVALNDPRPKSSA